MMKQKLLLFLKTKGSNKVYVQIDQDIPMTVYRSFIEKVAKKGIQVYVLYGSPQWVAPNGYTSQNQLMEWRHLSKWINGGSEI